MRNCDYNCVHDCKSCDDECKKPCSCAEPVFSIDARSDELTQLKFNVNGKSVWYDFEPTIKAGETCTTLSVDAIARTLNYLGECGANVISARELGAILHLGDLGDVNTDSIVDNGILNYRKDGDCGEGCDGIGDGWVSTNPVNEGRNSLDYILGSDSDGKLFSLMPPANTNQNYTLTWDGANKAKWKQPVEVSTPPRDADGKVWRLYVDPNTKELVVVRENP